MQCLFLFSEFSLIGPLLVNSYHSTPAISMILQPSHNASLFTKLQGYLFLPISHVFKMVVPENLGIVPFWPRCVSWLSCSLYSRRFAKFIFAWCRPFQLWFLFFPHQNSRPCISLVDLRFLILWGDTSLLVLGHLEFCVSVCIPSIALNKCCIFVHATVAVLYLFILNTCVTKTNHSFGFST